MSGAGSSGPGLTLAQMRLLHDALEQMGCRPGALQAAGFSVDACPACMSQDGDGGFRGFRVSRFVGINTDGFCECPDDAILDALFLRDSFDRSEESRATRAAFVAAADLEEERVSWLWDSRIPFGALTVLAGDPGLGKSTLTCEISARVSRGERLHPEGGRFESPANVLMLSAEDALGAVVRPRLRVAGADLERVQLESSAEGLSFPSDIDQLAGAIEQHKPALITIDPFVAFLDAGLNAHRDQHVRRALRSLADLAESSGAAIIVAMHLNKSQGGSPIYRLGGSIGFSGAARSVLLVGRSPDAAGDDPSRIVAVIKSSYAPIPQSVEMAMHVGHGEGHPRLSWVGTNKLSGADLLQAPPADEGRGARGEAAEFLRTVLQDGPRPAVEVFSEAAGLGIARKTLKRAKSDLGVRSDRRGGAAAGGSWWWSLPATAEPAGSELNEPESPRGPTGPRAPAGPLSDPVRESAANAGTLVGPMSLKSPGPESDPLSALVGPRSGVIDPTEEGATSERKEE